MLFILKMISLDMMVVAVAGATAATMAVARVASSKTRFTLLGGKRPYADAVGQTVLARRGWCAGVVLTAPRSLEKSGER